MPEMLDAARKQGIRPAPVGAVQNSESRLCGRSHARNEA